MKDLGNYECERQISLKDLMDLIAPVVVDNEPPILLSEGQTVYKVVRGDVEECIAEGRTWVCGEDNRGYDLDKGMAWNTQIDKVVFTDLEAAKRVAERYLAEHEHVLGKDIRATEVVAYRYMYNGLEIVNFYAVLENGDVYFRYGGMYEHIGKENEIKKFEMDRKKCVEFFGYAELKDFQPEYANMYKCAKRGAWLYAKAQYEFIE